MARKIFHERSKCKASFFTCSFALCLLCALICISCNPDIARADETDFSVYHRVVEFCRGHVKRPLAFDLDQRVLCFDGVLTTDVDISQAKSLKQFGFLVVRSIGGDILVASTLADIVRHQNATVVVYDYCFSACASYLLLASYKTFVVRDTLVAWHYTIDPRWCPALVSSEAGDPKRVEKSPCPDAPPDVQEGDKYRRYLNSKFYTGRTVDPLFDDPPESFAVRKILKGMFEGTGRYPDVLWTWNPRYYASLLKTKITYEAYPRSQDEVDALVARYLPGQRVIYDP